MLHSHVPEVEIIDRQFPKCIKWVHFISPHGSKIKIYQLMKPVNGLKQKEGERLNLFSATCGTVTYVDTGFSRNVRMLPFYLNISQSILAEDLEEITLNQIKHTITELIFRAHLMAQQLQCIRKANHVEESIYLNNIGRNRKTWNVLH